MGQLKRSAVVSAVLFVCFSVKFAVAVTVSVWRLVAAEQPEADFRRPSGEAERVH